MNPIPQKLAVQIISLRKSGISIPKIAQNLKLPKSTVWRYVQGVELTKQQKEALLRAQGGSAQRRLLRESAAANEADQILLSSFQTRFAPCVLSSLYWAEGTKSSFVFTNTDADMIRVFLHILRSHFNVSDDRLQVMVRLGSTFSSDKEIRYWSQVVGIPCSKIRLNVNAKYNRTTTKHGLCRITVAKGGQLLKTVLSLNKKLTKLILSA